MVSSSHSLSQLKGNEANKSRPATPAVYLPACNMLPEIGWENCVHSEVKSIEAAMHRFPQRARDEMWRAGGDWRGFWEETLG